MKIKYDDESDCIDIKLSNEEIYDTARINDNINLDLTEDGTVVNIEILYVKKFIEKLMK